MFVNIKCVFSLLLLFWPRIFPSWTWQRRLPNGWPLFITKKIKNTIMLTVYVDRVQFWDRLSLWQLGVVNVAWLSVSRFHFSPHNTNFLLSISIHSPINSVNVCKWVSMCVCVCVWMSSACCSCNNAVAVFALSNANFFILIYTPIIFIIFIKFIIFTVTFALEKFDIVFHYQNFFY